MSQPENPIAFPACNEAIVNGTMGMTLRDWFAGQALVGIGSNWSRDGASPEDWALFSYDVADAMLAERAKVGAA